MTAGSPTPPPNPRRRFLIAMGFGAASAGLVRALGPVKGQSLVLPPVPDAQSEAAVELSASPPVTVGGQSAVVKPGLGAPPALADAGPEVDPANHVFDIVISGGRVIDPMSGFDGMLDVGIDAGVITAIGPPGFKARALLDATDRVVSPGFVDILSYEPNPFGIWFKAADGVTTNFAMHGVNNYAGAFFARYEGATPIHFGGAFHQHFLRAEDLGARPDLPLSQKQIEAFADLARRNLAKGFAGVAFSPEYSPGTTIDEIDQLAAVAMELGHVGFFHTRSSDPAKSKAGVVEVIDLARRTGLPVHVSHIHSTGATFHMEETLGLIESARDEGLDVTACVYPYDFWATTLGSFRFGVGWQDRYRITYEDLQIAGTDQRLSADTFIGARDQNKLVAALGSIPEVELQMALKRSWMILGSDSILETSLNNHPRACGTFSRMLGRYVRDLGVVDLLPALAMMTSLPTMRIEGMVPAMKRKGRLQRGADADITIFNPATIADQATVSRTDLPAVGIDHVLVEGQAVMIFGELKRSVRPGRALRSEASA